MATIIIDDTKGLSEEQQVEILRRQHLYETGQMEAEPWDEVKKRFIPSDN